MIFKKQEKQDDDKVLHDGSEEFDNTIIDLTRERLSQEFDNVTADELKGSILIGTVAAIIGIIITISNYMKFLFSAQSLDISTLLKFLPMFFLVASFYCGITLVYSRQKLKLIKPRETNNDYVTLNRDDLRKQLKKELIENFEFIESHRKSTWFYIDAGFILLIAGVGGIFITFILYHQSIFT